MSSVHRGHGVIEMVVVVAIVGIAFASLYQLFVLATRPIQVNARETEAVYLAEEGIEAVRIIRGNGWTTNIAPLVNGTTYYPQLSGGTWSLTTTNPGAINNIYTRTVVFAAVNRDINDNITTSGGVLDPDTKKVTTTISWTERGTGKNVVLETYITDFMDN